MKGRTLATLGALAVAFSTEAEMFAHRNRSLPSTYPKRSEAESAERIAKAEAKRIRKAAVRKERE